MKAANLFRVNKNQMSSFLGKIKILLPCQQDVKKTCWHFGNRRHSLGRKRRKKVNEILILFDVKLVKGRGKTAQNSDRNEYERQTAITIFAKRKYVPALQNVRIFPATFSIHYTFSQSVSRSFILSPELNVLSYARLLCFYLHSQQ